MADQWSGVWYGAIARAAALISGDPDWTNVTAWDFDRNEAVSLVTHSGSTGASVPVQVDAIDLGCLLEITREPAKEWPEHWQRVWSRLQLAWDEATLSRKGGN